MEFPLLESDLCHSPERVRKAILGAELRPFFAQSGFLAPGGLAKSVRWQAQADGSLTGKLGYLRSKNLCVFRFGVRLDPVEGGTRAVIEARHGPYSGPLLVLGFAIGLCLCLVGVIIPYMGAKAIERGLRRTVESLQRHLEMWDETTSSGTETTSPENLDRPEGSA